VIPIGKWRGRLLRSERFLGDVQALSSGDPKKIGKRIVRRAIGRMTGRAMGRLYRLLWGGP